MIFRTILLIITEKITNKTKFEQYASNEGWNDIDSIPNARVWEEMNFLNEIYFDDAMNELKAFFENKMLLVCGNVGRWNGNFAAGKVIDVDELYKCWSDCDYVSIYDNNGHLFIQSSHHDGTNCYEVKILTDKGYDRYTKWYDDWNTPISEEEIHEKLSNDAHYTHIPHFAKMVYGCKTR